jgi:hypothetical protein
MSSTERDARLIELVAAFTEMGPAWLRWLEATIRNETVSFVRLLQEVSRSCHSTRLDHRHTAENP